MNTDDSRTRIALNIVVCDKSISSSQKNGYNSQIMSSKSIGKDINYSSILPCSFFEKKKTLFLLSPESWETVGVRAVQ